VANILTQFAASEAASGDLFSALGIDWKMLILQIIAFLLLVWLLGKFVYPWLMKQVDERQEAIEATAKAAEAAQEKAEAASAEVEKALRTARREAADIVATAKAEAVQMNEKAEKTAKARAERIVAEAREELAKDIAGAKKTLEKDTLQLVKRAASLATAGVADAQLDAALIKKSLEESVQGAKK